MPRPPSGRREQIGLAALAIVGTGGLHALTHRAVDAALAYPAGTTSYYARTRRELVTLAVEQLVSSLTASPLVGEVRITSDDDAVDLLTTVVTSLIEHDGANQLARLVLVIDLREDEELHDLLHARSESVAPIDAFVSGLMTALGVADAEVHTRSLLALIDGLMFNALTSPGSTPVRPAIEVFWAGLPRVTTGAAPSSPDDVALVVERLLEESGLGGGQDDGLDGESDGESEPKAGADAAGRASGPA